MRRTDGSVKRRGRAALVAGAVLLAGSAQAQPADPAAERVRFTVQPVEGGLLRLDTQSGALSFCAQRASGWACEAVPDDRAALEAEIDRLQARIATLEKSRAPSGAGVPDIMAPPQTTPPDATPPDASPPTTPPPAPSPEADGELPAQARERLDQAMNLAEHAFRRFVEMVERLRKDLPPDGPPAPLPPKGEPF